MTESRTDPKPRTLDSTIGAIATLLAQPHAAGLKAELRRMREGDVDCSAFWKIAVRHLADELEGPEENVSDRERRWGVILSTLASMPHRHRPGRRLGAAMAEAGVSEARVLKLLRARGSAVPDTFRAVCHQLETASQPVAWSELAHLILSEGRSDEERVRRRIARAYYRSIGGNS
ncbi:MAG TPA: type I-E CRISPR-associated protein Cse2/CasB [Planctomycetota bacterium]|nr:type I-E CRISPR-associated protein Cse2/CasB [Planctomycetota bacterium]